MLSWIAVALSLTAIALVVSTEVRFGMELRRLGRIRPTGSFLARWGFDLADRLMRRR